MATTRQPTPGELQKVNRFLRLVKDNRSNVAQCLNTGRAARDVQGWIDSQGLGGVLPRTWNGATDQAEFDNIARRATLLERYAFGLETGSIFFRVFGDDIEIVIPAPAPEGSPPGYSLGIVPLVIAIVVGVVLLAGAITTAIGFYMNTRAKEAEERKRIAELDAAAARAGGDVAARWNAYKKDNAAANEGFFGKLGSNLGIVAVVGGIIALAIIGSKYASGKRAA
jgi:outer membrane murein-binding lipoprotein Lpp